MQTLNVTEARKQLSQVMSRGETIEIKHPSHSFILIPKEKYQDLELQLMDLEIQKALAKNQKRYSSEEIDAMLSEVLGDENG